MPRHTSDRLLTACANRGISVTINSRRHIVLEAPTGEREECKSYREAFETYQSRDYFHGQPLVHPVRPARL